MLAEVPPAETIIVTKGEKWLTLKAAPYRLARVKGEFTKFYGDRSRSIGNGEIIYISMGTEVFGCAEYKDLTDTGEQVPCFADLDRDGLFEAVIMKKISPGLNSYPGSVSVGDLEPISPLSYELITDRDAIVEIKKEEEWQIEHRGSTISICQSDVPKEYRYCLNKKGKMKRSDAVQRVEYKGAVFEVKRLDGQKVSVRIETPPSAIVF
ncbi:hypothetical protein [Parerythrobacter aestuarii]|uniref:hypothetical protein n=1 Tax=Parerythrobacter aestuarii TaxID=3020909 RepID=UPI0024DEAF31|nr:hypothetical protein [Parerythrobacter aestuarii]